MSIFTKVPIHRPKRNVFNLSHERKMSASMGNLIPIFCQDLVPGDVFRNTSEIFMRFAPMIAPVMHRVNVYTHFFFVPNRLVMPKWTDYITGNDPSVTLPVIDIGKVVWEYISAINPAWPYWTDKLDELRRITSILQNGSLSDYFGLPTLIPKNDINKVFNYIKDYSMKVQVLPFLAYQLIWNEYYRDQNLQEQISIDFGDMPPLNDSYEFWWNILSLRKRNWEKDYFTSALPWAQKGEPVRIPGTGGPVSGMAQVILDRGHAPHYRGENQDVLKDDGNQLLWSTVDKDAQGNPRLVQAFIENDSSLSGASFLSTARRMQTSGSNPLPGNDIKEHFIGEMGNKAYATTLRATNLQSEGSYFYPSNPTYQGVGAGRVNLDPNGSLWADMSTIDSGSVSTGGTINDLRTAFQIQKWLERNARAGTRYIEQILAHFGVRTPDSRLQRPEYIGGGKSPVVISEVLQTSQTDSTPQATMAGHGLSAAANNGFHYKALEHGYIIGLMSVMPRTAYQQGIPRHFLRNDKFDFYWPTLANLGEQPVMNQELKFNPLEDSASPVKNDGTFGYQSRYSEYKYCPSTVHGDMRDSLKFWHMGRVFGKPFSTVEVPDETSKDSDLNYVSLNSDFIECNPTKRIFAYEDPGQDDLWIQVYNNCKAVRPMPRFAVPGFADHN